MPTHVLSGQAIAQRGKWWAKASLRAQQETWRRAREHQVQKAFEIRQEQQQLVGELEGLLGEQMNVAAKPPPVCMSAAALSHEDLEYMGELLESTDFCSKTRVNMARALLTTAPPPMWQADLPAGTVVWKYEEPTMPTWAKDVAMHREFFQDCALVCCVDGETQYWKLVYCVQSPKTYIAVCRLHPADDYYAHRIPIDSSIQDFASAAYDIAFRLNFGVMCTAADMPEVTTDQLSVLFNLKHEGGFL